MVQKIKKNTKIQKIQKITGNVVLESAALTIQLNVTTTLTTQSSTTAFTNSSHSTEKRQRPYLFPFIAVPKLRKLWDMFKRLPVKA